MQAAKGLFAVIAIVIVPHCEGILSQSYIRHGDTEALAMRDGNISVSVHHTMECAASCTADHECAAANHDPVTGLCVLLKPPVLLTDHPGSTALVREYLSDVIVALTDHQIGMWPLNERFQGKNLVPGGSDIDLYNVGFVDASGQWFSPPVRFSGATDSWGQFSSIGAVTVTKSFGWIASIYQGQPLDLFPLLEWANYGSYPWDTHIWVVGDKLFIHLYWDGCTDVMVTSTTTVGVQQWTTLALSYDGDADTLSMWVNGQLTVHQLPTCNSDLTTPEFLLLGHRMNYDGHITGHINCMSLYDRAMTYEEMYASTIPLCRHD